MQNATISVAGVISAPSQLSFDSRWPLPHALTLAPQLIAASETRKCPGYCLRFPVVAVQSKCIDAALVLHHRPAAVSRSCTRRR